MVCLTHYAPSLNNIILAGMVLESLTKRFEESYKLGSQGNKDALNIITLFVHMYNFKVRIIIYIYFVINYLYEASTLCIDVRLNKEIDCPLH